MKKKIELMGIAGDNKLRLEMDENGILAVEMIVDNRKPWDDGHPGVFLDDIGIKRLFDFMARASVASWFGELSKIQPINPLPIEPNITPASKDESLKKCDCPEGYICSKCMESHVFKEQ